MKNIFSTKQFMSRLCFALGIFASLNVFAAQQEQTYMTAKRYDVAGRLTGTISPDPDGGGNLRLLATRNTYNATTGLLETVEQGELANWSDENTAPSAWTGFKVYSSQKMTYDNYGRKITVIVKDNSGNPVSLTQTNYDTQGRVNCVAVRMNSASFNSPGSLPDACVVGTAGSSGPDRITQYTYDGFDHVVTESRAVGTSLAETYVTNTYSGLLLTSQTDANQNRTELRYDANFRLVKMVYPSASRAAINTVNEADYVEFSNFDDNGNAKTERKRSGALINYTFDANNRKTYKDFVDNTTQQDVSYNYDLRGLLLSAKFGSDAGLGITTAYDGFGSVKSSTSTMGGITRTLSYTYDLNNNRTSVTHPDGTSFGYNFDGLNRLKSLAEGASSTMLIVSYGTDGVRKSILRAGGAMTTYGPLSASYALDDGVHLKTFTQDFNGTANDLTTTFGFNSANQIDSLGKNNTLYYYQGNDNRTGAYTVNGLNQYTSIAGQTLSYDANANLTGDGSQTYTYDAENRLISTNATGTNTPNSSLVYDPNGRLFQSTITANGVTTTTQFLYDGDALVAEYVNGSLTRRYVHGDQVDQPLVQYNNSLTGASYRRYLHTDHQGSIIAHSDSNGNVFTNGTLAYDNFGIPATKNFDRFGYTGQIWFKDLGLYYYKARFYAPKLGRFLQTDPIGYKDDMDLYSYVGNDPLNKTDPTGLCPMCIGAAIGAGINIFTQVSAGMASGQDFSSALKSVSVGQVLGAAAVGAVGGLGVQMVKGAVSGTVSLAGQAIKVEGAAARVALAVDGSAKAAAAGATAAALNGKDSTGVGTASLAKVADGLAGVPIGTAVNTAAGNAEKIGQVAQTISNGVDSAKQASTQAIATGQASNAAGQKACSAASGGLAMGCH